MAMSGVDFFATPWWVNLLILIPAAPYLLAKKEKVHLGYRRLAITAAFAVAFAFVEAAVVVYLRASAGMLPVRQGSASGALPDVLLRIEIGREAATMVMLFTIAVLAGRGIRQRFLAFLWTFAIWDIFYYVWLAVTIGWPDSLLNKDLLFLIPVPWFSQVWFPLLVSGLTIVAVLLYARRPIMRPVIREESHLRA